MTEVQLVLALFAAGAILLLGVLVWVNGWPPGFGPNADKRGAGEDRADANRRL